VLPIYPELQRVPRVHMELAVLELGTGCVERVPPVTGDKQVAAVAIAEGRGAIGAADTHQLWHRVTPQRLQQIKAQEQFALEDSLGLRGDGDSRAESMELFGTRSAADRKEFSAPTDDMGQVDPGDWQ
jgi:hypothetical protein